MSRLRHPRESGDPIPHRVNLDPGVIEMRKPRNRRTGFTLVELMVSLGVLGVILSIALPNLLRMYMVGNEGAVMEAMRAVVQSCESYRMAETDFNRRQYPQDLAVLAIPAPRNNLPYLDGRFMAVAQGGWRGYRWTYAAGPLRRQAVGNILYSVRDSYALRADPVLRGVNGQRSFYADSSGVVRFNLRGQAGPNDAPVE